jgi:hypothetical protein
VKEGSSSILPVIRRRRPAGFAENGFFETKAAGAVRCAEWIKASLSGKLAPHRPGMVIIKL